MVVKLNQRSGEGYITMFLITHNFLAELRHLFISLLVLEKQRVSFLSIWQYLFYLLLEPDDHMLTHLEVPICVWKTIPTRSQRHSIFFSVSFHAQQIWSSL